MISNSIFLTKLQFDRKKDTRKTLYKKIEIIRNKLELKKEDNIDFIKKIESLGFVKIMFEKLGNLNGLLDREPNKMPVILLNKDSNNLNFVLAHELVHFFLSPNNVAFDKYDYLKYKENEYEEWRANEGAAELLLPYKEFIPDYCYFFMYKNEKDCVYELSKIYCVSKQVIKYRIKNLKKEIGSYLKGIDIEQIEIDS